jgi:glycosyltransferase involved in cell wall biosynthesis
MKIIHFAVNDPAGMGIAFVKAINRCSPHRARLVTWETRYNFRFEKDFHIPRMDEKDLECLYSEMEEADIFHFHILIDENHPVGNWRISDFMKGKRLLHHHHGHPNFRSDPGTYVEKYKKLNRPFVVSTPDLVQMTQGGAWQPNLVPLHDPLYRPGANGRNGKVLICHSPTRKELKNTAEFVDTVKELEKKHPNIENLVIENTPHKECLRIKQNAHIHFDHMQGYFGVSSLEGLSQGKPVIAGLDDFNIDTIRSFTGGEDPPWVVARDPEELSDRLDDLVRDTPKREEQGAMARAFMEAFWSEERALEVLLGTYEDL